MHRAVFLILGLLALSFRAAAIEIVFEEGVDGYSGTDDNSLYEDRPDNTNGAHRFLYAGNTKVLSPRRALVRFDVAAIPAGSTITAVQFELVVQRRAGQAFNETHTLHRLLKPWGEGNVDAQTINPETDGGLGAPAEEGDATWTSNFHNQSLWDTPGGDFISTPSGSAIGRTIGTRMTFNDPLMAADVQHWVDHPEENFGWIVIGNEIDPQVAYRFYSSEGDPTVRPRLTVNYEEPPLVTVPVIVGIGDIIIGDLEGSSIHATGSATLANHFVYPDAVNLDYAVEDADTPEDEIKWSFTGGSGRILINGVAPLGSGLMNEDDPTSPRLASRIDLNDNDPESLDADPFTLTFRNAELSPVGGPNTEPGVAGIIPTQTTAITLFASDCTTFSSRSIVVYTANDTSDSISPIGADYVLGENFTAVGDSTGWIGGALPGFGGTAFTGLSGLCLMVPGPGENDVLWVSPEAYFELVDSRIYRARTRLTTDQTNIDAIPLFFFVFDNFYDAGGGNNYGGFAWVLDVDGGAQGIGRPNGRNDYEFWFTPNAVNAASWRDAAFTPQADATNDPRAMYRIIDSNDSLLAVNDFGTICIDSIQVEGISRNDLIVTGTPFEPPIATQTHVIIEELMSGGVATIDNVENTALIQMPTVGEHRSSLYPFDPLLPSLNLQVYPVVWEGDSLYRTRVRMRGETSETDPADAVFTAMDVTNSELGAYAYTTRGAESDWTYLAASPKLLEQEYESYFYSHNATDSIIPDANRLRPFAFFINSGTLAGLGTGGDAFVIQSLEADKLIAP